MKRAQPFKRQLTNPIQRKFDKGLQEGNAYYISKFRIVDNTYSGKLRNHKYKIWFENSTSLITVNNNVIPKQVFKIVSFRDIIEDNISPGLAVDILGELISYKV